MFVKFNNFESKNLINSRDLSNNKICFKSRKIVTQSANNCARQVDLELVRSNFCYNYLNKIIDFLKLEQLGIPNLHIIDNKGVRGETLSSSRNSKFIPLVKECGIDTIVDLRTSDYTERFSEKCRSMGLQYFHIPIDKSNVSDRDIIDNLPTLFKILQEGKFYIACAQGKHRTDIALAINYVLNPMQKIPPVMYGHTTFHIADMADINRRLNSLYKSLTNEDKQKLGWSKDYDQEFIRKKRVLKSYSETYSPSRRIY